MSTVKLLGVWTSRNLSSRCFNRGVVGNTRINYYGALRCLLRPFGTVSEKEAGVSPGRKRGLRAADIAEKLRREKEEKPDAKNKVPVSPVQRNVAELRQLTQQLQSVHPNVFAKALSKSILYQDQNLIAINKPYGVPVYSTGGIGNSIAESLPVLAKIIDCTKGGSKLHVCYNLEKDTTGVLFLARTEETAERIHNLIRSHQAEKRYMVITVGVPVPSEGVIDIPIIEKEVMGDQHHFKMGLSPLYRPTEEGDGLVRVRANRQAQSAVTHYKVLDSSSGCSLVELQPVTGVKHQLRVHMALALACPILGDHKYTHWNKLAPQKLPEGVLRRLGLEQSKTRHLPLHLHVRQITLPGVRGHDDLTVSCLLPKFFTAALKKLQIELPEKP
ncbi:pseudouridylate synthase RPUSD4, mitochondrial [Ictalurus punctatus]|uniref:Pseudouridylate synthase RPUSD4, mitochondrial n=1 Tax=Ictalurus punctatus TaxID=7998 RepID=E3TG33_ICTPU|nr:pseudouridylate synthase RPUSD4, mitochondrial [Ictalurus punctatus]ADO29269.1 RNA pseudouridylate synthase domain-containing protein 4 [Ictalurus punctatus]